MVSTLYETKELSKQERSTGGKLRDKERWGGVGERITH